MSMHPAATSIALMLFDPNKQSKSDFQQKGYEKYIIAAKRTVDKLDKIVENSEDKKLRYRINPKTLYDEIGIKKIGLSEGSYHLTIQALLIGSGLDLDIRRTTSKGGRSGYWLNLSPYVILQFKQRLNIL